MTNNPAFVAAWSLGWAVSLNVAAAMFAGCTDQRLIEPNGAAGVEDVLGGIPIGWHGAPGNSFAIGLDRTRST